MVVGLAVAGACAREEIDPASAGEGATTTAARTETDSAAPDDSSGSSDYGPAAGETSAGTSTGGQASSDGAGLDSGPGDSSSDGEDAAPDLRLLHCGADGGNLVVLDLVDGDDYQVVWEWVAADAVGWSGDAASDFGSLPECKVVEDGTQIAVAGNSSVALIDFPSGEVVLHGPVNAAHSVALLPGGRLVGVGSTSAQVRLFQIGDNETVVWEDEMDAAHAAVWDRDRELVYVVGDDRMRRYTLTDWDTDTPSLSPLDAEDLVLPDRGAHDLSPLPGTSGLALSTRVQVWIFDRDALTFAPLRPIATVAKVKSVDVHPVTGRMAIGRAQQEYWTTEIELLNPEGTIALPDQERLYKVRWFARETAAAL